MIETEKRFERKSVERISANQKRNSGSLVEPRG